VPGPLEPLADAALGLARTTTGGRIALAAAREVVPAPLLPPRVAAVEPAAAEPLPWKAVAGVLRDAWGAEPEEELDAIEREPAAVTPTSQVHRGTLDGEPVAVKVLRPGVAEVVRSDLRTLEVLAAPLRAVLPRLDAGRLLAEARERALDELDLEHEASAQRRLARAARGAAGLVVPAPVMRLSHPTVLVAGWVEGTPVGELAGAPAAEREAAARALVRLHVGSAREGLAHCDPHPRHALVTAGGDVALLDHGGTRAVASERVDRAMAALEALLDEDGAGFGTALAALGWLPEEEGPAALALAWDLAGDLLAGPAVLDVDALLAMRARAVERRDDVLALAARATLPPEDLLPLRMLGALALVLAPLAVELDWPEAVRGAAARGFAQ
jgi:predicted unusual protein kinase regulating ubiquinone biosynthesis (AarF/ABC1/UbiB family)